ncbi:TPA: hypothetical protein I7117_15415 [Vibrio vulnificus]|nr:hypothetical protein [Vibrio navarrensis]HAS6100849.1 hypothetical protein [Vibrio vulnificus]
MDKSIITNKFSSGVANFIRVSNLDHTEHSLQTWKAILSSEKTITQDEKDRLLPILDYITTKQKDDYVAGEIIAKYANIFRHNGVVKVSEPVFHCTVDNANNSLMLWVNGQEVGELVERENKTELIYNDTIFSYDGEPMVVAKLITGVSARKYLDLSEKISELREQITEFLVDSNEYPPLYPENSSYMKAHIESIIDGIPKGRSHQLGTLAEELQTAESSRKQLMSKLPTYPKASNYQQSLGFKNLSHGETLFTVQVEPEPTLKNIPQISTTDTTNYWSINAILNTVSDLKLLQNSLAPCITILQRQDIELRAKNQSYTTTNIGSFIIAESNNEINIKGISINNQFSSSTHHLHRQLMQALQSLDMTISHIFEAQQRFSEYCDSKLYELQRSGKEIEAKRFQRTIFAASKTTPLAHQEQINQNGVTSAYIHAVFDELTDWASSLRATAVTNSDHFDNDVINKCLDCSQLVHILRRSCENLQREAASFATQLGQSQGIFRDSPADFKNGDDAFRFLIASLLQYSEGKTLSLPRPELFDQHLVEQGSLLVNSIRAVKTSHEQYDVFIISGTTIIDSVLSASPEELSSLLNSDLSEHIVKNTVVDHEQVLDVSEFEHYYHGGQRGYYLQMIHSLPNLILELNRELQNDSGKLATMIYHHNKYDGSQRFGLTQNGFDTITSGTNFRACLNTKVTKTNRESTQERTLNPSSILSIIEQNGNHSIITSNSQDERKAIIKGSYRLTPVLFERNSFGLTSIKSSSQGVALETNNCIMLKLSDTCLYSPDNIALQLYKLSIIESLNNSNFKQCVIQYLQKNNYDSLVLVSKESDRVIAIPVSDTQLCTPIKSMKMPGIACKSEEYPIAIVREKENQTVVGVAMKKDTSFIFEASEYPTHFISVVKSLDSNSPILKEVMGRDASVDILLSMPLDQRQSLVESLEDRGYDSISFSSASCESIMPFDLNHQVKLNRSVSPFIQLTTAISEHMATAFSGNLSIDKHPNIETAIVNAIKYSHDMHPLIRDVVTKKIRIYGEEIPVVFHGSQTRLSGEYYSPTVAFLKRHVSKTDAPKQEGLYYASEPDEAGIYARDNNGNLGTINIMLPSVTKNERVIVVDANDQLTNAGVTFLDNRELLILLKKSPILKDIGISEKRLDKAMSLLDGKNIQQQLRTIDNLFWPEGQSDSVRRILRKELGIAAEVTLAGPLTGAIAVEFPSDSTNAKIFATLHRSGAVTIENSEFSRDTRNWRLRQEPEPSRQNLSNRKMITNMSNETATLWSYDRTR